MTDRRSTVDRSGRRKSEQSVFDCESIGKMTTASIVVLAISFLAMIFYFSSEPNRELCNILLKNLPPYNSGYPLSAWIRKAENRREISEYRFAVVTDLDHSSKVDSEKHWRSYLRKGTLRLIRENGHWTGATIVWDKDFTTLKSTLAQGGRSMELSDLAVFNGHLISVDDRTGVLYKINGTNAVPWVLLADGDGNESKGFKGEWLAVKDEMLYVGGLGKEWTTITGEFVNTNPMWIKRVTHYGFVQHIDWQKVYVDLRAAAGIHYPGYMIHESGRWSSVHKRWFFMPRRASKETYTEEADESRATNILLIATEDFGHIETKTVGELSPTRGVSGFQFVPGTDDGLIIALKSEEDKGTIASYVFLFDLNGQIIMPETKLEGSYKFEGVEFI